MDLENVLLIYEAASTGANRNLTTIFDWLIIFSKLVGCFFFSHVVPNFVLPLILVGREV